MKHAAQAKLASDHVGGSTALAKTLNRAPSEVCQWISGRRPIPISCAAAIEKATSGLVSRKALFPDSWAEVWPELAMTEEA